MLILQVHLVDTPRGPGIWKFHKEFLQNEVFVQAMSEQIRQAQLKPFEDPNIKWEWVKHKIRELSIKFTIEQNRNVGA